MKKLFFFLLLDNGDTVPISRAKKEAVLQALDFF